MRYLDPPIGDFGQNYGQRRRPPAYGSYGIQDQQQTGPADNRNKLGDGNPYTGGLSGNPGGETLDDLYARMGFGESTVRGNNPGHSILNKMLPAMGSRVLDQIGWGNSLEPGKRSAIMSLIRSLSPGNKKAKSAAYGVKAQQDARRTTQNTPTGYGSGFTEGLDRDAYNRAGEATRSFDAYQDSPSGESDALQALLSAYGSGQDTDLDQFLAMLGIDSPYNQFRQTQAGKGSMFGGLSGVLGQLGGMYMQSQGIPSGGGGDLFGGVNPWGGTRQGPWGR